MSIEELLSNPSLLKKKVEEAIENKDKETLDILIPVLKNPRLTYTAAKLVYKHPKPEWEDIIAQNLYWSYIYAKDILKDRFKKGEKIMIQNKEYLNRYIEFLESIG